jgi:hypothetical protein
VDADARQECERFDAEHELFFGSTIEGGAQKLVGDGLECADVVVAEGGDVEAGAECAAHGPKLRRSRGHRDFDHSVDLLCDIQRVKSRVQRKYPRPGADKREVRVAFAT